jgi:hypothetical protein
MTKSKRIAAANRFCHYIHRSNELHAEYLDDAKLLNNYERFTNWQMEYLLPFFADLHNQEGYAQAVEFTMSDLAGVGIGARDRDLERVAPAITKLLPLSALETIANAAAMNARVLEINTAICRCMLVDDQLPAEIGEHEYFEACRAASSLEECLELAHLITSLGHTLKSLVKIPLIGMTLRAMRAPARAAGFEALQDFLESGYSTFRQIPDIDYFLKEIEDRMILVFEKSYTSPLPKYLPRR